MVVFAVDRLIGCIKRVWGRHDDILSVLLSDLHHSKFYWQNFHSGSLLSTAEFAVVLSAFGIFENE